MRILQFDDIRLNLDRAEVTREGRPAPLEGKPFEALAYLARNAGRVVPVAELLGELWSAGPATEEALDGVIARARQVLGAAGRRIEAIPGEGFRLAAKVTSSEEPDTPRAPLAEPRKINWLVPVGALSAIALAYVMPLLRNWTGGEPQALKPTQFTATAGLDGHPSFSPDGSHLVFTSDKTGQFEIYVKPVAPGGQERAITSDGKENLEPAWSPDGSRIAYQSLAGKGLYVVPAAGGTARRIADFGSQPAWSADGKQVVFRSAGTIALEEPDQYPGGPSTLWVVGADGGKAEPLTQSGTPAGWHTEPRWSPGGKHVGFLSHHPAGDTEVWEMEVATRRLEQVSGGPAHPTGFVYAADGATLLMLGYSASYKLGLYRLSRDAATRKSASAAQLTEIDYVVVRDLALSPQGDRIAYSATNMTGNLWQVDKSGQKKALTNETEFRLTQPVFSPDGTRIEFLKTKRTEPGTLWIRDLDGRNLSQITGGPGVDGMASWLPDGTSIVHGGVRDGKTTFFRLSLVDATQTPYAEARSVLRMPRLSPDGTQVVFQRIAGDGLQVWKMDAATGQETLLTPGSDSIGAPCWSPDGKRIAATLRRGEDAHLVLIPAEGGAWRQVTDRPGQAWSFSWSPGGKEVAVAASWDGAWNIYAVHAETGAARKLTDNTLRRVLLKYPAWSPAGEPVVFEWNETKGNVYLSGMPR